MEEIRNSNTVLWVNMKGGKHFKRVHVDKGVMLKWILKKWGGRVRDELNWLRISSGW
jgi:hypothetical protein